MSLRYDLHSHSTASDGSLAPAELMHRAAAAGVNVLALTDHDDVAGLAEATAAAQAVGLQLVPGVEVSVTWRTHTIHIVGLHIDPEHPTLLRGLEKLREYRDWRGGEIARRLERAGITDALAGAAAFSSGRVISRTHYARFLAARGYAKDARHAFQRYLSRNTPGYVPSEWAGLEEGLGWIEAAGGQAVLAHPARYKLTGVKLRALMGEFKERGGTAIEVVSGSHSRDDYFVMGHYSRQFGLYASAGSDYHGPENVWLELGRLPPLPEGCRPIWESWEPATAIETAQGS